MNSQTTTKWQWKEAWDASVSQASKVYFFISFLFFYSANYSNLPLVVQWHHNIPQWQWQNGHFNAFKLPSKKGRQGQRWGEEGWWWWGGQGLETQLHLKLWYVFFMFFYYIYFYSTDDYTLTTHMLTTINTQETLYDVSWAFSKFFSFPFLSFLYYLLIFFR